MARTRPIVTPPQVRKWARYGLLKSVNSFLYNKNNNNKIQHLYSAIFTECSMALYIVSRIIYKIFIHLDKISLLQYDL